MLKTKDELATYLNRRFLLKIKDGNWMQSTILNLNNKRNIPVDLSSDLLSTRLPIISQSNFILYCMLEVVESKLIPTYFTEKEIEIFKNEKYKDKETVKFPLKIDNCIEIVPHQQWLTKIDCNDLIRWRDAQIINYNENTQRTMQKVVKGDTEIYQISINKNQVIQIEESITNGYYIPNTLTINIPMDVEYQYNDEKKSLIIENETKFDIIDGYHRYIAISDIFNKINRINLVMELRICRFDASKAKQFIWQEDQKTQMRKIVSDSYNQMSYGIQITNMLNQTNLFMGLIRNDGIINESEFARAINIIFYYKAKVSKSVIISDKNEILRKLDKYLNEYPEYFEKQWTREQIVGFTLFAHNEIPIELIEIAKNNYKISYKDFGYAQINKFRKEVTSNV